MKRQWSDYSSQAFAQLDRDRLIAVLPVGAIEQHGPHLPMSVDACVADGLVDILSQKLPEASPVLFLPTQAICKSNEHLRYPGTLTLSAETLIRVWTEIGACVARSGVRKMVLLNSHGGNISTMDIVARELRVNHDMMVFSVNWFGQGMPEGVYSETETRFGIHAGDMETSVMLALDPGNVDMSQAQDFRSRGQDLAEDYQHLSLAGEAKPGWQIQDMNPYGACGEAHLATAEKGQTTLDFATDKLVEVLNEIDQLPVSWLDEKPAW
ncbi:MAG: creatininase family protein [Rhodobacteraceae bacterium]|nr:creatininase family protein [Paracoccaceae bacterium]